MTVHRYWTGPDEPEIQNLPNQVVWHDEDIPAELEAWMSARHFQVTDEDVVRHRSNMLRWWLLWEHGGVWLDHDVEVLTEIPDGRWVVGMCAMSLPRHDRLAGLMLTHIDGWTGGPQGCRWVSGDFKLPRFEKPNKVAPWMHHRFDTSRQRLRSIFPV